MARLHIRSRSDAPGESWLAVSLALMRGSRGLCGRSSLSQLLSNNGRFKDTTNVPSLSIPQILAWADAHHARTGKWPNHLAGPIPEAPGESWKRAQGALVAGTRGLPGGSSLAQLLAVRRGLRNPQRPPKLTISQILEWADAFHAATRHWPNPNSGPIPEAPGETWCAVVLALKAGRAASPLRHGSACYLPNIVVGGCPCAGLRWRFTRSWPGQQHFTRAPADGPNERTVPYSSPLAKPGWPCNAPSKTLAAAYHATHRSPGC